MQMEMTGWVGEEGKDRFQILDISFQIWWERQKMKDKRSVTKDERRLKM